MPNLVGIGLSQVPTNSMLGGMAYQDPEHASIKDLDLKNLSQINAEITGTAYDTFVYDTRKDSDGGAWRKRTQHTSWYNITNYEDAWIERGSRKEFPSIAVIVADSSGVAIHDGDDPDLSLWMKFKTNGSGPIYVSPTPGALAALNGIIFVGANNGGSGSFTSEIGFIHDKMRLHQDGGKNQTRDTWITGMVQKSGGSKWVSQASPISISNDHQLIDRKTNDIAMTVLPNAPIDEVSGLPRPTIAVGTDGGASIIKDDGSVVDITITTGTNYDVEHIDFTDDNRVVILWNAGAGEITIDEIPSADTSANYPINLPGTYYNDHSPTSYSPNFLTEGPSLSNRIPAAIQQFRAVGTTAALSLFEENKQSEEDGMVAFISSSYNTGYQQGRIRGAFLSDTDTTNVTGEKIDLTNGSVPAGNNASVASVTANQLVFQSSSETVGRYDTGTTLVTGKQYHATLTISNYSGSGTMGLASGGGFDGTFRYSANGTYTRYITGDDSNEIQLFYRDTNSGTVGLTIKEVDIDRSVNNKGLEVHGTITKQPVVTGAELVSYSGFSASNHLAQPYNSDLNPGSGSYSVVAWFKTESNNSGSGVITGLGNADTDEVMLVYVNSSYGIYFDYGSGSEYVKLSSSGDKSMVRNGNWHQVVCQVTAGQVGEIYIDGIKKPTAQNVAAPSTWSQWDTNYRLYVGCGRGLGNLPFSGSISLVRYSLSNMSPEQIKKIFEDEKHLFQENAKATLYGSSDAVTALAYDDTTNLLYAGTSAGRSEFQGLRRINNTTTAVTTAISASNGLVAEQ